MGVVSTKVGVVDQTCVCAPPPPRKKILYETLVIFTLSIIIKKLLLKILYFICFMQMA